MTNAEYCEACYAKAMADVKSLVPTRKAFSGGETIVLSSPKTGREVMRMTFNSKKRRSNIKGDYGTAHFGRSLDGGANSLWFFSRLFGGPGNIDYMFSKLTRPGMNRFFEFDKGVLESDFRDNYSSDFDKNDRFYKEGRMELAEECLSILLDADRNDDGTFELSMFDDEKLTKLDSDYSFGIWDFGRVPIMDVFYWKAGWRHAYETLLAQGEVS